MVSADKEVDISWVLGISYGTYIINQARQQVRFRMNEVGALAESVTLIAMTRCASYPKYYEIDGPFMCVITRPGVALPVFVGYLDTDVFADPDQIQF